jgi:ClpP class serine protease
MFILLQMLVPVLQQRILEAKRQVAMRRIEVRRRSRVITMIHRQESMSLLGFPIACHIDIEDSERVMRATRLMPPETPMDIVLHTPRGLVLAAEQLARTLRRHPARVTVFVPHYAMSGGTLIGLAARGS